METAYNFPAAVGVFTNSNMEDEFSFLDRSFSPLLVFSPTAIWEMNFHF
jgi:hypothetical protein